jgi:hypothetical protein
VSLTGGRSDIHSGITICFFFFFVFGMREGRLSGSAFTNFVLPTFLVSTRGSTDKAAGVTRDDAVDRRRFNSGVDGGVETDIAAAIVFFVFFFFLSSAVGEKMDGNLSAKLWIFRVSESLVVIVVDVALALGVRQRTEERVE